MRVPGRGCGSGPTTAHRPDAPQNTSRATSVSSFAPTRNTST